MNKVDLTTALHKQAFEGHSGNIQALLLQGADPNAWNEYGETALHQAAVSGTATAVKVLLAAGAEVQHRDRTGSTALHEAVGANFMLHEIDLYIETITALLDAGADINARNDDGTSIWDVAPKQPGYETLRTFLIERGAQ